MWLRRIANEHKKPGAKFLVVGVLNTLSGLVVIFAAKWALDANDVIANMLGYGVGIVLGYNLNARWTFEREQCALSTMYKYGAVLLVAYLLNLMTVLSSIRIVSMDAYIAQTLGVIPYALFTYMGSKYFVFRTAAE